LPTSLIIINTQKYHSRLLLNFSYDYPQLSCSYFPVTRILMTSLVESLCMWFDWALTIACGQCGNFTVFLPVSGLPFPLLAPHLSPRSFIRKLYKGEIGVFTIYQFLTSSAATIAAILMRF
jgi:hypothetical protein